MASAAGMVNDDTIVEVGGKAGPTVEDLRQALIGFAPGQQIPIVVQRDGERNRHDARLSSGSRSRAAAGRFRTRWRRDGWSWTSSATTVTAYTRGVPRFHAPESPRSSSTSPSRSRWPSTASRPSTAMVEPDVATYASLGRDRPGSLRDVRRRAGHRGAGGGGRSRAPVAMCRAGADDRFPAHGNCRGARPVRCGRAPRQTATEGPPPPRRSPACAQIASLAPVSPLTPMPPTW